MFAKTMPLLYVYCTYKEAGGLALELIIAVSTAKSFDIGLDILLAWFTFQPCHLEAAQEASATDDGQAGDDDDSGHYNDAGPASEVGACHPGDVRSMDRRRAVQVSHQARARHAQVRHTHRRQK